MRCQGDRGTPEAGKFSQRARTATSQGAEGGVRDYILVRATAAPKTDSLSPSRPAVAYTPAMTHDPRPTTHDPRPTTHDPRLIFMQQGGPKAHGHSCGRPAHSSARTQCPSLVPPCA